MLKIFAAALMSGFLVFGLAGCQKNEGTTETVETKVETTKEAPAADAPAEQQVAPAPAEQQPAAVQPAEQQPAAAEPTENKPAEENKPADVTPAPAQ